jgi:hypothetical protein
MSSAKPKFLRTAVVAVAAYFALWTAAGQTVGWHNKIDPHHVGAHNRGRGIDLRNPDQQKPLVAALDWTQPNFQGPTDGDQNFTATYANSALEVASSLGANLAFSVKSVVGGANLDVEYAEKQSFTQDSVTFIYEGTRDFGSHTYPFSNPLDAMSPEFKATIGEMAKSLRGEVLHREVTRRYGSHFVYGYRSVARVRIVFQLSFASSFNANEFRAKFQGNYKFLSAKGEIAQAFSRAGNQMTVSYRFYSSEQSLPPEFKLEGELKTFQEFDELTAKANAYLARMSSERSKVDSWIVAPLMNLPGYFQLLGGYSPGDYFETRYQDFIRIYSEIRGAKERLDSIVNEDARMSWLNAAGKSLFRATHRDLVNQLDGLNQRALDHFKNGAELQIKDSELAALQAYNRLPFPRIRMIQRGESEANRPYTIGLVDAGPVEFCRSRPFSLITHYFDGRTGVVSSDSDQTKIYYTTDLDSLLTAIDKFAAQGLIRSQYVGPLRVFVSQTLTPSHNPELAGRVQGLFFAYSPSLAFDAVAAVLLDGLNNLIELAPWSILNDQPSGSLIPAPADTALSVTNVAGVLAGQPANWTLQVTNAGLETVIGTRLRLPLATGFEFVGVTGSQGIGGFTNGVVEFQIGALGAGRIATVTLSLRQLTAKPFASPGIAVASVDDSQPETTLNDNRVELAAVRTVAPKLNILRPAPGTVELSWEAPTGILKAQRTGKLMGDAQWVDVPASVAGDSVQSVRVTVEGAEAFFRLSPAIE